jgi:hypothetical protein
MLACSWMFVWLIYISWSPEKRKNECSTDFVEEALTLSGYSLCKEVDI